MSWACWDGGGPGDTEVGKLEVKRLPVTRTAGGSVVAPMADGARAWLAGAAAAMVAGACVEGTTNAVGV